MLTKLMKQQYKVKFIEKPNLPEGEVAEVAIAANAKKAIETLASLNVYSYEIKKNCLLPDPVNYHADLQMLHLGNNKILTSSEHLCAGEFNKKFNVVRTEMELGNKYPKDVPLNCKIIGNNIFLNRKTISPEILEYAERQALNIINVNQGYAGCSICAINESAIITDDESIFAAAGNFLNDVLFVSKGSIRLEGYNYGFIGGCCGKISRNKLAVNGRIESHKDYKDIIDFTAKHNVEIVELADEPLTDIGGILPLTETVD